MNAGLELAEALIVIDLSAHWEEISQLLLEGVQTARMLDENYSTAYHLMKLGICSIAMGVLDDGYKWLQDGLNAITLDTNDASFLRRNIYDGLSEYAMKKQNKAEALRYAEMSLAVAKEAGRPDSIAISQLWLARILYWCGDLSDALTLTEDALATRSQLNIKYRIVVATAQKIEILIALGMRDAAQAIYQGLIASDMEDSDRTYAVGRL